jgi:UDP-N-acetylglucosamine 2-epimerase (non-hydrolysing)/GDP/UDP-N,N'-diacetylbacillosamine 2-epimerase (hydrolysing)
MDISLASIKSGYFEMKRKICIITGTRAEYGLLYWIIKGINEDPELELQLIVTGMHLSTEFGLTLREIEKDGFPISEKVEMLLSSDTETAIAMSMGIGMMGFARAYERLQPDVIAVLGDRFEIFSAVSAALPFRIPVAHIHGGESTEGAIDESIRHAITKMSHIHFTAADIYRKRVIEMGENSERVFCFGAPALDGIHQLDLIPEEELCRELGIPGGRKLGVVTYHPVTLEKNKSESQMRALLEAISDFPDVYWIITFPNSDTNGRIIIKIIDEFIQGNPEKGKVYASLGQLRYLSLLRYASLMVGNSSSGIIEAPSFKLPVVNIGERQAGRMRGENVIDVECEGGFIAKGITKALSFEFSGLMKDITNPYGRGNTSGKIIDKLKNIPLTEELVKKRFCGNINEKV